MANKLTDAKIRNLKPKEKPYREQLGGNTYLEVLTTGRKVWRMRYRNPISKKDSIYTIGDYPDFLITDARRQAEEAKKLVRAGTDPNADKRRKQQESLLSAENTFRAIALEWHSIRAAEWTPKHAGEALSSLEKYVFPYIGDMPITDLKPVNVLSVLKRIESRGALDYVKRIRQRIGGVFRYAVATGRVEYNPVPDLKDALATRKVEHYKHLDQSEIPAFLSALNSSQRMDEVTRLAIRFTLLTFVRTKNIMEGRWADICLEKRLWRIPAEQMKAKQPHIVPLSTQTIDLLKELEGLTGNGAYLFSLSGSGEPISNNTMLGAIRRMGWNKRTTVHGFRSTASTTLNEVGFRPDVIERQLAHGDKNKVRAAYNHAQYLEERRELMQWWGDFIERSQTGAKVIPIKRQVQR